MTSNININLTFSNNNIINNKKVTNNVIKNRIISNLKKAEKVLSYERFKELQNDLILNLRENNIVIANINNNSYKLDIFGGGGENTTQSSIPYSENTETTPSISHTITEHSMEPSTEIKSESTFTKQPNQKKNVKT